MTGVATGRAAASAIGTRSALPQTAPAGEAVRPLQDLPVTLQPHESLLKYYLLTALMFGPGFFFAAVPYYFRYRTLRYEVDDEGITMRWGVLFRREISLTYARIQDIQLTSNVVERWFGLARIQLQTASGNASAEMTVEGIQDVGAMRDFLYSRMRGAADARSSGSARSRGTLGGGGGAGAQPATVRGADALHARNEETSGLDGAAAAELAAVLDAVAAELRAVRLGLRRGGEGTDA